VTTAPAGGSAATPAARTPHPAPASLRAAGAGCPRCGGVWVDPQYGLEPRLDDYLARLVAVFDQARRVLAPTGPQRDILAKLHLDPPPRIFQLTPTDA
jgi:hypothetical protein